VYALAAACEKLGKTGEARRWYGRYAERFPDGAWAVEARRRIERLEAEEER